MDNEPGDRASACHGLMHPIGLDHRSGKGYVVRHRCARCGALRTNRVAELTVQPDSLDALIRLATGRH